MLLTVKHVERNGTEGVFQAVSTRYDASDRTLFVFGSPGPDTAGRVNGAMHFGDGRVYVMNANGKTVATYDLEK